ncbi:dephospho-CoA kinase [Helicobacter turcicus]|uniref:Dephospho-CoA kinase n=1 Tax=Helicobacter turcicus TaxID=2867412 RepID=A0ABS7JMT7_9HELI|nr:dephospho-CoA kinase [Helicobacter turcicus]MBX7490719.1 dephospho-CoA kinase [Helicobacter turcicus]MBX7545672.1 dephospho-CoA kinase [Helicobacter turcicus]
MSLKYAIALSGGIGSGKSTVASLLRLYGYQVICADSIAHKVLEENKDSVIAVFGEEILDNQGRINRKKLGGIVFSNTNLLKRLEEILHPKIKAEILEEAQREEQKKIPYFVDIPLFFEQGDYPIVNSLLISTTQELQIERLKKRNGFSKKEALSRINAQMPLEQKYKMASYVIDNCGSLESLQQELEYYLQQHLPKF